MRELICRKLQEIELAQNVTIIYAAESGSRAWGFASPDSDYDVRFLYVRRPQDYLKIDRPRDVIEWQLDETLDINGWDIQKALRLLRKSNPTLFEWANSPIIYQTSAEWESLLPIINRCFSSQRGLRHYLSIAVGNYREYLKGEQVRMKKYLYVLRPILACKWILAHDTPPPMVFDTLVAEQLDAQLKPTVAALLEKKTCTSECELAPRIDVLNRYIEEKLFTLTEQVEHRKEPTVDMTRELDTVFLKLLSYQVG